MKLQVATVCMLVCAWPSVVGGQAPSPQPDPLHRQYREGEKLAYHMKGINEAWHYEIDADGLVKKDAAGKFFEEYQWTHMESAGRPQQLAASAGGVPRRPAPPPPPKPPPPRFSQPDPHKIRPHTPPP